MGDATERRDMAGARAAAADGHEGHLIPARERDRRIQILDLAQTRLEFLEPCHVLCITLHGGECGMTRPGFNRPRRRIRPPARPANGGDWLAACRSRLSRCGRSRLTW